MAELAAAIQASGAVWEAGKKQGPLSQQQQALLQFVIHNESVTLRFTPTVFGTRRGHDA